MSVRSTINGARQIKSYAPVTERFLVISGAFREEAGFCLRQIQDPDVELFKLTAIS
jgi:hypothetical protein